MTNRILTIYYSHSGNTQKIAKLIQDSIGGDLFEVQEKEPYPRSYNAVVEQAKKEIRAGYKPELKSKIKNLELYHTIFVGSPNWWSTIAPPVTTFLSENNFSGKTIVPFCTHGGGGLGKIETDIKKLCPNSIVLESFEIYGDGGGSANSLLNSWLQRISLDLKTEQ